MYITGYILMEKSCNEIGDITSLLARSMYMYMYTRLYLHDSQQVQLSVVIFNNTQEIQNDGVIIKQVHVCYVMCCMCSTYVFH